ncbi:MAG: right-handed parallel beta-helix repeat-containing protein, partial [Verrucomicrobia bacterium]|nr:right-handed parallel beta-helix repeat-containing protein [Verrucomicrobiota bacterium]
MPGDPYGGEWTYVASVPERGSKTAFTYYGDRPKNWSRADEAQVHIFPGPNGFDQCVGLKSVDAASRTLTLASETDHELLAARRYYVRNVPEELDAPGEWYLDRRTSTLYFYPPRPVASGKAFLSLLDQAVSLSETAHVTLRGFTIECCRGSAIVISGGASNLVAGCSIRNTGLHGVEVTGGAGHGVVGCDIYDTARGGIVLGGGDRQQLTPAGHYADNNHIHHCGRVLKCFEPAIKLEGVGCRASHNLLHDLPHLALGLSGNDHVIEFNEIHHVCQETSDSGAFQTGRDWTFRGNVIRHNSFHDIYGYGLVMVGRGGGVPQYAAPHTAHGVLLDDGASGFYVFGNLFYRISGSMVQSFSGRENVIRNNIFVEGQPTIATEP